MLSMVEEASVEFDEEDLQEKAMIGNLLARNYEREISDSASNSAMRVSRQADYSQIGQGEDQDLTQSLLSGQNST